LGKYLFGTDGGMLRLLPSYLAYYRPSFHPWQHDNRHLLEAWKQELQGSPVYQASGALAAAK
jgi:predicted metal-dependent hydrolase